MIASELYAKTWGVQCVGGERCHWCSAPCGRSWFHDDPPPLPFRKNPNRSAVPSSPYICVGCWRWRQARITVRFLVPFPTPAAGETKNAYPRSRDGQTPSKHSWLITGQGAFALQVPDYEELYRCLLAPVSPFVLALTDGSTPVNIHLQRVNEVSPVLLGTELHYTLNNIPHTYTPYSLEEGLRGNNRGNDPGVLALMRFLGKFPIEQLPTLHGESPPDSQGKRGKQLHGRPIEEMGGERLLLPTRSGGYRPSRSG